MTLEYSMFDLVATRQSGKLIYPFASHVHVIWELPCAKGHVAQLIYQFCHIFVLPDRIAQTGEHLKHSHQYVIGDRDKGASRYGVCIRGGRVGHEKADVIREVA